MREISPAIGLDDAGVPEYSQVLRRRAGRDAKQVGKRPHAERPPRQKPDDLQALLDR